ncbi:MAG TPA: hypothetical protein PK424_01785, partial [Smithella sp.]|nr:hypothetical protein [Smithella sp.]
LSLLAFGLIGRVVRPITHHRFFVNHFFDITLKIEASVALPLIPDWPADGIDGKKMLLSRQITNQMFIGCFL